MVYKFKDLEIELDYIIKQRNVNSYLRYKNGRFEITSPLKFTEKNLEKLLTEFEPYIRKCLKSKIKAKEKILHLFGIKYNMVINLSSVDRVYILNDDLIIDTRSLDDNYIKILIDSFYVSNLKKYVDENYFEIYLSYSDIIPIKPSITYKSLTTCYGKYNKRLNEITLSAFLAKYEPIYIRQVICHELTHYKYMNHQKEFYDLLESKLKNAKKLQHELRMTKYNDYF